MKHDLLAKLRTNGIYYLVSAFLLLLGVPLYQTIFLDTQGYGNALHAEGGGDYTTYLSWISTHSMLFIINRLLLALAFVLLFTLPFSLFRIIVAQELVAQAEAAAASKPESKKESGQEADQQEENSNSAPTHAWRGKGFAVIALWAGFVGLVIAVLSIILSCIYYLVTIHDYITTAIVPGHFALLSALFSIITNTLGIGLIAISTLFFGAIIARRGRSLWPGSWIVLSYIALATAMLLSGSAVAIASNPNGQAILTTPALLLFAVWVAWIGIMLVRLRPEK